MKVHYYPETDSLYIDLSEQPSVDSEEVAPGVVLDFDGHGQLVGIDIQHAAEVVDLTRLDVVDLPAVTVTSSESGAPVSRTAKSGALPAPPQNLARIRRVHPRAYERWTADDDARMIELAASGRSIEHIAAVLQRQPSAIKSRLEKRNVRSQQRAAR